MTVDLTLGARPDEPGPPIGGTARYADEVSDRLAVDAKEIIARYPQQRSALLPLLHLVQSEDGYLTAAGIDFCATQLDLTGAEVTAVATFYSMYRRRPTGTYLVGVCTNTLCAIMGGDHILATLEDHLGIAPGDTTDDGAVTLEHVECNAACDYAPVVMVNWEFFDNQTPGTACELVDALRNGEQVTPTRGAPPATFKQTARTLAGLPGGGADDDDSGPGAATLAGLNIARDRGMAAPAAPEESGARSHQPRNSDSAAAKEAVREAPAPGPSARVPAQSSSPETDPAEPGRE